MSGTITIENGSDWPTSALLVIFPWLCQREGVEWNYRIKMRRLPSSAGLGGRHECIIGVGRRTKEWDWPNRNAEHKSPLGHPIDHCRPEGEALRSRLEYLVFIAAHEICHANRGDPSRFRDKMQSVATGRTFYGRVDRRDMEETCDRAAWSAVEDFREAWPYLRGKIVAKMRREIAKRKAARAARRPENRAAAKLEQRRALLSAWERKQKFAANKVKKYRRTVRELERRVDRLAAQRKDGGK